MQNQVGEMQKIFSFFLFKGSFLLPGIVFSHALLANAQAPAVQNSNVDVPFCYMETADGRNLDLRNLCSPQPEATPSTCTSSAAGMQISNVKYDGNSLTGQVTNHTCATATLIKVNYQIFDDQGNQIDNGFIYAEPSTLVQGKTGSFGGAIAPGSKVNVTHVEWTNA